MNDAYKNDARERYKAKMRMPQYDAYRRDERLAESLYADCLREAEFSASCRENRKKRRDAWAV